MTREALAVVEDSMWPGNIRELEAVLEEAIILRAEGWVRPQDLNFGPVRFRRDGTIPGRSVDAPGVPSLPLSRFQREALRLAAERQEVRRRDVMARCGISRQIAGRELASLVSAGLLRQVGAGRGARYVSAPAPGG